MSFYLVIWMYIYEDLQVCDLCLSFNIKHEYGHAKSPKSF